MSDFLWVLALLCAISCVAPLWRRVAPHLNVPANAETVMEPTAPPSLRLRTLADAMRDTHADNLLLLRVLAASLVIYAHSSAISSVPGPHDVVTRVTGVYGGSVAVYLFFIISGFLVTGSWLRRQHLGAFLGARALRILPAYAACLAGCAFVLGPLVSTLPPGEYFAHADTWRYLWHNLRFPLDMQWTLPGVFETHARRAVNGSLWTLPAEVRVYVWLAIFGVLGLLARVPRALLALALLMMLVQTDPGGIPLLQQREFVPMAGCFALGACAWLLRRLLPLNLWLLLGLTAATWLLRGTAYYFPVFLGTLAYAALWFAYVPKWFLGFNRIGDYSYGLYLWGFPMQQLAVHLLDAPSANVITLVAWPAALLLAIASWHLIERPALHLRRKAPAPMRPLPPAADASPTAQA